MNKQRREAIAAIVGKLSDLQGQVDELLQEEQEYFDNMPEGLQAGDKGDKTQCAIDALQAMFDGIDEVVSLAEIASE